MTGAPGWASAVLARGFATDRRTGLVAAVLAAGIASLALAAPIDPFDGGITASAATFTLHGLFPYRDYWLLYGPLAGWMMAGPLAIFGPSTEMLRAAGLMAVAGQAYLGCRIVLRWTGPGAAILLAISASVLAPGFTGLEITAWSLAMVFALVALRLRLDGHSPVLVGCLVGLAFLTRLDLGGYVLLACLALPGRVRLLIGFGAVTLPVVGLVVLSTSAVALADQLIWYPTFGLRRFRVLPDLAATMSLIAATVLAVPLVIVPRLAVLASALSIVRTAADPAALVLTVFAALVQLQALGRADAEHYALAAMPAILLIARWLQVGSRGSTALLAFVAAASIGGAMAGFGQAAVLSRVQETALLKAVDAAALVTTRDQPIFVGLMSHRYTFANPVLVYYLSDRRPGSTWTLFNPGLTNTDLVQHDMIFELESSATDILVLDLTWAGYREAENESHVPGSDVLDRYIVGRFHVLCDFGAVQVWARDGSAVSEQGCPILDER